MLRFRNVLLVSLSCGLTGMSHAQAPAARDPGIDYVHMTFQGRFREAPRTQYARLPAGTLARTESFRDLDALKKTLKPDDQMRHKYAKTLSSASRFPEELRNVSVDAWIHAVKLENGLDAHGNRGDSDFHVMLGTSPKHGQGRFFSAKVSGLPKDGGDAATFTAARRQLVQLLLYVAKVPQPRFHADFAEVDPPLKVRVAGSLFFDGQSASGKAGPDYARATSAWQIDPVMAIDQQ